MNTNNNRHDDQRSADPVASIPAQIIAQLVATAGTPAERAAWNAVQDELISLRAAERAIHELINTLAAPAVAGTSVPADTVRHALQVAVRLPDNGAGAAE
jgi:hypothetical protein